MKREFSYFKRGNQYFPLIDVELIGPKDSLVVKALIDSGASFSLFRPEIANYLGIPVNIGRKLYFQGIKGKIVGYLHQITMRLDHKKFDCYIAFSKELDASFSPSSFALLSFSPKRESFSKPILTGFVLYFQKCVWPSQG